ncbi:MAG: dTMP kinase [Candidatus Bathyarchaeia archaeon]
MKGLFICIEGLDGCGKTTQAKLLVKALRKAGYDAVYTAEPSKGKIGKFIKRYCLNAKQRVSTVVEALLFAADRFEHLEKEVVPALENGKIVVSDRYIFSSLAYQGAAGLDFNWIEKVNVYAIAPDLALFLDVKPEVAIQRVKTKKSVMENLETQKKVRDVYMKFVEIGRLVRIDGDKPKTSVARDVLTIVLKRLNENFKVL